MTESTTRNALGAYHAVAGVAGIATIVWLAPSFWRQTPPAGRLLIVGLLCVMATVFLIALAAGVLLLLRRPSAFRLATLVQLLQLPVFTIGAWKWSFFAGLYAAILVSNAPGPLSFDLGAKAALILAWAGEPSGEVSLGINVVPLAVLWLLRRLQRAVPSDTTPAGPATSGAVAVNERWP
jgi:hypothetical protein